MSAGSLRGAKLSELPKIMEAPPSERAKLVSLKLKACHVVYDFTDPKASVRSKEVKQRALEELLKYFQQGKAIWAPGMAAEVMAMASANIFRPVGTDKDGSSTAVLSRDPNKRLQAAAGKQEEDEEESEEKSFPHLRLVYEIIITLVMTNKEATSKKLFTKKFLQNFLALLDSEDRREREYLKTILHRIYGKCMEHRPLLRTLINNIFYTFVYETESFNGIAELLDILGSIINGFALPLKQEHQRFLCKILIPLHKVPMNASFFPQLSFCISQYASKDPKTIEPILNGLLRYWPKTAHFSKHNLFLAELEEILEMTPPEIFQKMIPQLFAQISRAMTTPQHQVASRALYLWNNETIVMLVAANRVEILPIVFSPLYHNSENHWNENVRNLTYNVLKLFMEMDSVLFDQVAGKYYIKQEKIQAKEKLRLKKWERIAQEVQ